jgi:large subunit ribosomal protein L15
MKLNEVRDRPGAAAGRKRLGRGIGSGLGKTSGKGHKGQKARSGGQRFVGFEGGQMPLYRRLPKRGFRNPFREQPAIVNVGQLQAAVDRGRLDASQAVSLDTLRTARLVGQRERDVRLLAKGELKTALSIEVGTASPAAIAAVERAGGKVTCSRPRKGDKTTEGAAP